jgi:hypothetical protein
MKENQKCIEACQACTVACEHCANSCLAEEDMQMMAKCISLDHSCADLCSLAAREMARRSPFAVALCGVCAEACDAWGEECAKHDADHCQQCAAACRRCAEECRKMAA